MFTPHVHVTRSAIAVFPDGISVVSVCTECDYASLRPVTPDDATNLPVIGSSVPDVLDEQPASIAA